MNTQNRLWTDEETEYMRKFYGTTKVQNIQKELFKISGIIRSCKTISCKAHYMKITPKTRAKRRFWLNHEIELLRKLYQKTSVTALCKIFDRNYPSLRQGIRTHCQDLVDEKNIETDYKYHCIVNSWENEEIEILVKNKEKPIREMAKILNRTESAIRQKRSELNLGIRRNYTEEEDKYITENYKKIKIEKIAEHLKRSYPSLVNRIKTLKKYKVIENVTN